MAINQQLKGIKRAWLEEPHAIIGYFIAINKERQILTVRRPGNVRHEHVIFVAREGNKARKWRHIGTDGVLPIHACEIQNAGGIGHGVLGGFDWVALKKGHIIEQAKAATRHDACGAEAENAPFDIDGYERRRERR